MKLIANVNRLTPKIMAGLNYTRSEAMKVGYNICRFAESDIESGMDRQDAYKLAYASIVNQAKKQKSRTFIYNL